MTPYFGDFATSATVRVPWSSNGANGASITRGTDGSIRIYKDSSTTQRSSSAGITDSEDFDAITGVHWVTIDLTDNTDAGFYAAGHDYTVVLVGAVIDSQTVNVALGTFSIQNRYGSSATSATAIADAVLTRATSNVESTVKSAPKCLGAMVIEATHKWKDDGAGNLKFADSADDYAGTNALSRTIVATDTGLAPLKEVGGPA